MGERIFISFYPYIDEGVYIKWNCKWLPRKGDHLDESIFGDERKIVDVLKKGVEYWEVITVLFFDEGNGKYFITIYVKPAEDIGAYVPRPSEL